MDMANNYWEESSNIPRVKYENCIGNDDGRIKDEGSLYNCCQTNLNFSTANCSEDDSEYGLYKNKNKITRQDPKSHRIIEKRRRDRMNNCLADLSRLIPPEYLKKGRGRVEKTEIIEMAIKHMKYLQQDHISPCEHYRLGYQECMSETMRFMVEVEGHFPREGLCMRLLNHLQKHCEVLRRNPQVEIVNADEERHIMEYKCRSGNGHLSPHNYPVTSNKSDPDSADLNGVGQTRILTSAVLNNNTSGSDIYHVEPNGYKYKTNIKLRFSQDLAVGKQTKRSRPEVSSRRNSLNSSENQSSTHSSPMISEPLPPSSEHASDSGHSSLHRIIRPPNFPVPVFALHAKGSFYLPLTVDYHALLPFLRLHQCDLVLDALPTPGSLVLHPVTISVDFRPRGCASEGGSSGFEGSNGAEGKCKTDYGGWR